METVVEKLFQNAERHPDKLALVFENEEVTYGQLRESVIRLTSWFKLQGVAVGDRIVVQAAYCKWYFTACYAAHLCGAIFVPIEKTLTEDTLRGVIERMGARVVISHLAPENVIALNYGEIDTLLADVLEQPWGFPGEDLVANIMLTSGTTGPQKGVMLTQKNLAANCIARIDEMDIKKDDVGIVFTPLNHVACTRNMDITLYHGSTYIFLDGIVKLGKFYEFMDKYHVTSFYMPPSALIALESLSQNKLHDYANQIIYTHIGSAPIQEPQRNFLRQMLPYSKLFYTYGSSENGTMTLLRIDKDKKGIRCTGRPFKGVNIKILDDDLNEMGIGAQGRVAIRADMNCKGYWGMPELTENSYHNGYFLSNDVGYLDDEGFLYILGRIDDVINIGGLKVHPSEIENAALKIEGIEECLCFEVSNTLTGSAAKLLIKQKDGANLSVRDVRSELGGKLDTYKIPASIAFVSEIVKTATGKPDRKYYQKQENTKQ